MPPRTPTSPSPGRLAFAGDGDQYLPAPRVIAHVRYHQEHDGRRDEFGFVLDLILDGLERAAG